jgi:V/A-type H+-transporting ATPase subunit B
LEKALDTCWQTLGECFEPEELLMKQQLVERYFPRRDESPATGDRAA